MDCLTFISKLVEFLAWPTGLTATAYILRKELKALLPSITKVKAGPIELELARLEKQVEAVVEKTNVVIDKIGISEGEEPPAATPETPPPATAPESPSVGPGSPSQPKTSEGDSPAAPGQRFLKKLEVADSPSTRLQVLKALNHPEFAMRSLSGIAADTEMHPMAATAILKSLMTQGWVSKTINSNGQNRYFLTPEGSQVLHLSRVNLPTTRPGKIGEM